MLYDSYLCITIWNCAHGFVFSPLDGARPCASSTSTVEYSKALEQVHVPGMMGEGGTGSLSFGGRRITLFCPRAPTVQYWLDALPDHTVQSQWILDL